MMASMAAFTLNDTLLKLVGEAIPLFQLLFLRGLLVCVMAYGLTRAVGGLNISMARRDWGLIALRSGAEIGAAYFFLQALFQMPLANVTAILQVLPLTLTLGVALLFGEPVGWRRWMAIAVGFGGMVLIVQPGTDGFTIWSVYALIAVVFVTIRDLSTRRMSAHVSSMFVTLAAGLTVTVFSGLASLSQGWSPVSGAQWLAIGGSACFITVALLCSVLVMRVGEVSFIAPFRYTSLLFALLLGYFVFGDWPTSVVLLGAGIIAATGVFTLYREGRQQARMSR